MKQILISLSMLLSTAMAGLTTINLDGSTFEFKSANLDQEGVGFTYRVNDIIGFDLTAFAGSGSGNLFNSSGAPIPSAGNRAALLDEDLRFDTVVANPAASATAMTLVFDQPVFNNRGDDIILFEYDDGASGDAVDVRINGVTVSYTGGDYSGQLWGGVPTDVLLVSGGAPTLAALENNSLSFGFATSQNIFGVGIDLSDYGIAKDTGSVTSIQLGSGNAGDTADFAFIAGLKKGNPSVPEPSTGMFLFLGFGLLSFFRRSIATARRETEAV